MARRRPEYDPGTNSWRGITDRDWQRLQNRLDDQIRDGATFNPGIVTHGYGEYIVDEYPPDERFDTVIDELQSGRISVDEMHQIIDDMQRAAVRYAQGDSSYGRERWMTRNPRLPDEFFYYHWSF